MSTVNTLWTEKFRPKTVDDYVFKDDAQREQVMSWIKSKDIPHLLFSGPAGIGKTTMAKLLINQLEIDPYDVMEINASRERGIDIIRSNISNFCSTMPFGHLKVVLLDECLDENTEVVVMRAGEQVLLPIKEVNPLTDLVKSFNVKSGRIEWKSFELFDKGTQETLEIEFDNGEIVICTPDHKWYVESGTGEPIVIKASQLPDFMHILTS